MYVSRVNREDNVEVLHELIKAKPLGTWTAIAHGKIEINHIPFVLDVDRGEFGTLVGHVDRGNPIWRTFSQDTESVVVFHGEQAYISPSWYPSKHQHGKAVPTWNYAVVHAEGVPIAINDPDWLLRHLHTLTDIHESGQKVPWQVSDAPKEYIDKLVSAIVGIEIPISKLTGKWKLGQNRPESDKLGTSAGLSAKADEQSLGVARMIEQHLKSVEKAN